MRNIKIGSRASRLALVQANIIIELLKNKYPQYNYEIVKIETMGDKILDKTLDKIGGKGLFVKEIQAALVEGVIDIAVHSMKDMPAESPEELILAAITKREDPRDALVTRDRLSFSQLPTQAVIGSSSLRRQAQLLNLRRDIDVRPIRGNVETRIKKIALENMEGVVLAAAGLNRLGLEAEISHYFEIDEFMPAVGQGALGCEIRNKDNELKEMLRGINDMDTYGAVMAERSFLRILEGGCHVPIGAYGRKEGNNLVLSGMVASPDGTKILRESTIGGFDDYEDIGRALGEKMLSLGARQLL